MVSSGCPKGLKSVQSKRPNLRPDLYLQVSGCASDIPNKAVGGSVQVSTWMEQMRRTTSLPSLQNSDNIAVTPRLKQTHAWHFRAFEVIKVIVICSHRLM